MSFEFLIGVEEGEGEGEEENLSPSTPTNSPVDQGAPGGVRSVHSVHHRLQGDLLRVEARPGGRLGKLPERERVEEEDVAKRERLRRS